MSDKRFVVVEFKTEEDAKRYYGRLSVHIKGIASKRHCDYIEGSAEIISQKDEMISLMEEALEFYGDIESWQFGKVNSCVEIKERDHEWVDPNPPLRNTRLYGGKLARQTLAKLNELKKEQV